MDVLRKTVNFELYKERTDEDLVVETLKCDDIYAVLIDRYQKKLTRYIQRISSLSNEDAEEILQEIFIKTYKNLNDFDTSLKFSSWIYRIAHNEVISHIQKIKTIPFSSLGQEGINEEQESLAEKIATDTDIEREFDKKIMRDHITSALGALDKKYRDVLILRFLEEKDYEEISDILQKPIGTVSVLIKRAKEKFKNIVVEKNIHTEL